MLSEGISSAGRHSAVEASLPRPPLCPHGFVYSVPIWHKLPFTCDRCHRSRTLLLIMLSGGVSSAGRYSAVEASLPPAPLPSSRPHIVGGPFKPALGLGGMFGVWPILPVQAGCCSCIVCSARLRTPGIIAISSAVSSAGRAQL